MAATQTRGLIQSPEYLEEYARLSSKHRSQISRKTHDLMSNPRPGGSRTPLREYDGLYRIRAGDFRVIYAFDDNVVQLLTLRRRNERTYDDLDGVEIKQLERFRGVSGTNKSNIADWEELAKKWAQPQPTPLEPLPQPITAAMLDELNIGSPFAEALLALKTVDDLLDAAVPWDIREKVLEHICPRKAETAAKEPTPVVVMDDLVDWKAAEACGPIEAAEGTATKKVTPPSGEKTSQSRATRRVPQPLVVTTSHRREPMKPYPGNLAKGINKDTRYTVKLDGTIRLTYDVGNNERALLTTDAHPDLVELVNEAKCTGGSSQGGGSFVINEYRHVLVPTQSGEILFAGVYTRDLEFAFEKTLISPVAPTNIQPGDVWPGPHVGIKYTLAAGAMDVRYERETERGTVRRLSLCELHSKDALAGLIRMFRAIKPNGGAIYVNEAREVFAPVDDGGGYQRRYIGHLGNHPWFPAPS